MRAFALHSYIAILYILHLYIDSFQFMQNIAKKVVWFLFEKVLCWKNVSEEVHVLFFAAKSDRKERIERIKWFYILITRLRRNKPRMIRAKLSASSKLCPQNHSQVCRCAAKTLPILQIQAHWSVFRSFYHLTLSSIWIVWFLLSLILTYAVWKKCAHLPIAEKRTFEPLRNL